MEMAYADGFLIVVPTKNIDAYAKMSAKAGKVWMEYGALDYKECAGDDMNAEGMSSTFPKTLAAKKNETVVFSWIVYKSRKHRDDVLKKVMSDPRMTAMMGEKQVFDPTRMLYGGFEAIVDLEAKAPAKKTPMKKAAAKKKAAKRPRA
jgi:uncharacterized protein YbaA (DUF1428 family)